MRTGSPVAAGPRAPWLAPLPDVVPPDRSGAGSRAAQGVPVAGLVDEPDLQRVSPLIWQAADGSWLLSGPSGSGRTTALRAVVLAAAAGARPTALHVHVIDARGALADLGDLPHVGTRARSDDPRACAALVRHLRAEVDRRLDAPAPDPATGVGPASTRHGAASGAPLTLVAVDGWDHLVEAQPAHAPDELPGELLRVLRDGRAVGVVGVVSGGAEPAPPTVGRGRSPARSSSARRPTRCRAGRTAGHGPAGVTRRPGERCGCTTGGRCSSSRRRPQTRGCSRPARDVGRRSGAPGDCTPAGSDPTARRRPAGRGARRRRPGSGAGAGAGDISRPGAILVGVGGPTGAPWHWRPADDGRRLLVAGPPSSGRTNVLRVFAESLCAAGRFVVIVQPGSSPSGTRSWPEGVLMTGAEHPDALIRVRRDHPDLVLRSSMPTGWVTRRPSRCSARSSGSPTATAASWSWRRHPRTW